MSITLILPGLVAMVLGVLAGRIRWEMPPRVVLWFTTVLAAVTAITAAGLVGVTVGGLVAPLGPVVRLVERCPSIPLHHQVGWPVGLAASLIALVMAGRVLTVVRDRTRAVAGTSGKRLFVLDTAEPIAYAAPGSPGCVVVSSGMLGVLQPGERRVLFAHERAHLDQKHSRFLPVGALAVAVLPPLRLLVDQLELATERCADEAASVAVGGDRRLVARAVAKAAIGTTRYRGLVGGFGGGSVPVRVDALVSGGRGTSRLGWTAAAMALIGGFASGSVQVHHIVSVAEHVCGG